MTTISSRIDKLDKVIESLICQEIDSEFEVHLHISEESYLLDEGIKQIPQRLKSLEADNRNFKIKYVENIGPYRKIIPILKDINKGKLFCDYVVTVDDDTIYPKNWLNELVAKIISLECVVAYRGRRLDINDNGEIKPYRSWKHSSDELLSPDIRTVGTGKDGIIYRPDYFHPNVLNMDEALEACGHADDLWLKVHTAIMGVETVLINQKLRDQFEDIGEEDEQTLYKVFNKNGGNDRAMSNIKNYILIKYGLNLTDVFKFNNKLGSSWFNENFLKSL
ncbi:glycosyltransferase [Vibrio sp. JC009]|uniref:hypothetical protein n=1 Tax=Vibrio sp. JC009 TaxID=2912314 RepID=UPI0023B15BBB|nr:hypothetical protein [Vibrio sp. JC009]WED24153.1 glycosyltransferase [Vibrio sp. JC009]